MSRFVQESPSYRRSDHEIERFIGISIALLKNRAGDFSLGKSSGATSMFVPSCHDIEVSVLS